MIKVRYSKKEEINIAKKLWEENFEDTKEQVDFYFEKIFNHKNHLVLEEEGIIKSSLHENPYIFNFNKKKYKSKYIVGVSTDKSERKKGYMKVLITEMLKNLKQENYSFVFLTPVNPLLYRKYGFEYFSNIEKYKFDTECLNEINLENISDDKIKVFEITKNNLEKFLKDLKEIYYYEMNNKITFLERDDFYFKKLLLEVFTDKMKVYILYENEIAISYIIYGLDKENKNIEIRESFSKNINDRKALLKKLSSYKEEYKKIIITAEQNSNLEYIFGNQLNIEKRITPFMMMRIISPLNLLEHFKVEFEDIKIYIYDSIFEENTGIYVFEKDKNIKFIKESSIYDMKIDIAVLAQLLSSFLSFEDLVKLEKIEFNIKANEEKYKRLCQNFKKKLSYLYELI